MKEKPGPRKQQILERLEKIKQGRNDTKNSEFKKNELISEGAQIMRYKDTKTRELEELRSNDHKSYPGGHTIQLEIDELNNKLVEIFTELLDKFGIENDAALEAINGIIIEKELHRRENNPPRGTRR